MCVAYSEVFWIFLHCGSSLTIFSPLYRKMWLNIFMIVSFGYGCNGAELPIMLGKRLENNVNKVAGSAAKSL